MINGSAVMKIIRIMISTEISITTLLSNDSAY